jgi:ribose/xylose/arabinose/galactoside ABC-type transport system permease subunit
MREAAPKAATRRKLVNPQIMQLLGVSVALIVLAAVFTIASKGRFIHPDNLLTVARQVSITVIVGIGVTFIMITGNIDLAVGSYLALSGIFLANMILLGVPWLLAVVMTMVALGLLQFLVGTVIAKQRLTSLIVTLAMLSIARGIALSWSGGKPVYIENDSFMQIGNGYLGPIPIPVIIAGCALIIGQFVLRKTRFGRYTYAVGGNEEAARSSGIDTDRIKISVFVISGFLTGLAGCVMAGRLFSGSPVAGQGFELDVIASIVIGGTSMNGGLGSMIGTLIGAFMVGAINNGLTILGVEYYYQLMAKGMIIFLAILIDRWTKKVRV